MLIGVCVTGSPAVISSYFDFKKNNYRRNIVICNALLFSYPRGGGVRASVRLPCKCLEMASLPSSSELLEASLHMGMEHTMWNVKHEFVQTRICVALRKVKGPIYFFSVIHKIFHLLLVLLVCASFVNS